jgi:cytochrome oxidase Cu insertion factor (SCO1/SenC/PrrC family)
VEHYVLLGTSAGIGLVASIVKPSWWAVAVFIIACLALAAQVWYTHYGAIFKRGPIQLKVGKRLPEFTLPDSTGRPFESRKTAGKSSVLYLFYRGNW